MLQFTDEFLVSGEVKLDTVLESSLRSASREGSALPCLLAMCLLIQPRKFWCQGTLWAHLACLYVPRPFPQDCFPSRHQPILLIPSQVQDTGFVLVEFQEVPAGPFCQPVQVLLASLWCAGSPTLGSSAVLQGVHPIASSGHRYGS